MTTPNKVITFGRPRPPKHDCQGERVVKLDPGISSEDLRLHMMWQCEALIRHHAKRLSNEFRGPVDAAWFLRYLADEIEGTSHG